ncbi:MAG: glycoside hydrolase family 13 protein [Alkalispirochaetaceae bacterium]
MSERRTGSVPSWVGEACFYQIFPDRFARGSAGAGGAGAPAAGNLEGWSAEPTVGGYKGGTLRGITEGLDYLEELGVNAIYLNPIFASPANHRYHTQDYFLIDPVLGDERDFDDLLAACHSRGIRLILDGVFNHVGRGFFQFANVLENGPSSPYLDWFYLNPSLLEEGKIRAYPSEREAQLLAAGGDTYEVLGYRAWANLAPLPKLNVSTPEVREFLLKVSEYWIRKGIDGWRLDVPEEIDDPPFWREFRSRVRGINPEAYILGEIWHHAPDWLEGDRFDGLMNYPFSRGLLGFFGAEKLDTRFRPGGYPLKPVEGGELGDQIINQLELYRWETNLGQFNLLGSHDTPRLLTLLSGDRGRAALATVALTTLPGAPCIYYGDEIGMSGGDDPGCRGGFLWNQEAWDAPMRELYRRALALRRESSALRRGAFGLLSGAGEGLLIYSRWDAQELLLTLWNRSCEPRSLELPEGRVREPERWAGPSDLASPPWPEGGAVLRPLLLVEGAQGDLRVRDASQPIAADGHPGGGRFTLSLPPVSGGVYRLEGAS